MVKKAMYQKIIELKKQGLSKSEIALKLGISRKTVKKYYNMNEIFHDTVVQLSHSVYLITDLSQITALPSNTMSQRGRVEGFVPENLALNVIVTATPVVRVTLQSMLKFSRTVRKSRLSEAVILFTDTLEEAHALIRSARADAGAS